MNLKLIYVAENHIEANIIKEQLSEISIKCVVSGNNLESAIGELPVEVKFPKIYVNDNDYDKATTYIEHYKIDLKNKNIKENECASCQEVLPGTFSICWNCGNEIK